MVGILWVSLRKAQKGYPEKKQGGIRVAKWFGPFGFPSKAQRGYEKDRPQRGYPEKKARWDSIDIKDESYTSMRRRVGERCSAFKLEDDVRPEYDQDFDNIKCQVARWYVDAPRLRRTLKKMHFRTAISVTPKPPVG